MFAAIYIGVTMAHIPGIHKGQKEALCPMKLEL